MSSPAAPCPPADNAEGSAAPLTASSNSAADIDPHERDALNDLQRFMQPCRYFASSRCDHGDGCAYEHIASGRYADTAPSRAETVGRWRRTDPGQAASPQRSGQVQPMGRDLQASGLDKFATLNVGGSSGSSDSSSGYLSDKLQAADARDLLEVGVLPFRQSDRCTFQMLFGERVDADGTSQLCLISGPCTQRAGGSPFKRPAAESFPWQGAMNLLGGHAMTRLGSGDGQCAVVWLPSAQSAVYLLDLCGEMELAMEERFNIILGRPAAAPANEETWRHYRQLHWVELRVLLDCIQTGSQTATTVAGSSVPLADSSMHALRQSPLLNQLELMQRDAEVTSAQRLFEESLVDHSTATSASSACDQPPPQHTSSHCYVTPSLRSADVDQCSGAGVIAYRRNGDSVEMLFRHSAKPRTGDRFELIDLGLVGAKVKSDEAPAQTAANALYSLIDGGQLAKQCGFKDASELQQQLQRRPVMWQPTTRSAVFFLQMPVHVVEEHEEDPCVEWIELTALLRFLDKGHQRRRTVAQRCAESVQTASGVVASMVSAAVCILRRPPVLAALDQLLRDSSPDGALAFEDICAGRAARARIMCAFNLSQHSYLADKLKPTEAAGFRAAGVFAYRRTAAGDVRVLMGRQNESMERNPNCLNLLGGKIEPGETPAETAAREAWEESGQLLNREALLRRAERSDVMWFPAAKYALHFVELGADEGDICERYAANRADWLARALGLRVAAGCNDQAAVDDKSTTKRDKDPDGVFWEMEDLHWIDLSSLLLCLDGASRTVRTVAGAHCPVVGFAVAMLRERCAREKLHQLQPGLAPRAEMAIALRPADIRYRDNGGATSSQNARTSHVHRPLASHTPTRSFGFPRHEESPRSWRRT